MKQAIEKQHGEARGASDAESSQSRRGGGTALLCSLIGLFFLLFARNFYGLVLTKASVYPVTGTDSPPSALSPVNSSYCEFILKEQGGDKLGHGVWQWFRRFLFMSLELLHQGDLQTPQEYCKERKRLSDAERSLQFDASSYQRRTADEALLDHLMSCVKRRTIKAWEEKGRTLPAMPFYKAKPILDKTKWIDLFRWMPKGAALHLHMEASLDPSWIIKNVLYRNDVYINANAIHDILDNPSRSTPSTQSPLEFRFWYDKALEHNASSWMTVPEARKRVSELPMHNNDTFDAYIYHSLTIIPGDSQTADTYPTEAAIWRKFEAYFAAIVPLLHYLPVYKAYVHDALVEMIEKGIAITEFRMLVDHEPIYYVDRMQGSDPRNVERVSIFAFFDMFRDIVSALKQRFPLPHLPKSAAVDYPYFVDASIIYTIQRASSPTSLAVSLRHAWKAKLNYPDVITGFDLVGHEDSGRPLQDFIGVILDFRKELRKQGIDPLTDFPFYFHAGETVSTGTTTDANLYDAVLLGSRRIGHGLSLAKHPILKQLVKQRDIAIEISPISNQILKYIPDLRLHPATEFMMEGIPVVLCSDDPGVFGYSGLNYDFLMMYLSVDQLDLSSMKTMAISSIKHSSLFDGRNNLLSQFEDSWERFVIKALRFFKSLRGDEDESDSFLSCFAE